MSGVYKSSKVPVLQIEGQEAVISKDKAEMLVKIFKEVHSSKYLSLASNKKREEKLK